MEQKGFIIGHRNPDADAVCSAIGYAEFKRLKGEKGWLAARCGNTNARIDAILERFGEPPPVFVGDVTPRVRDIMSTQVITAAEADTCAEALEKIDRHDVRALPVVDRGGKLSGLLSVFQLGEYFIPKPNSPKAMRHVFTSIGDIARSLKATVLHERNGDELEDLYVRVGAMDIRTFGTFAQADKTLASKSVIVVGDRWDIQQKSIQARVRLLVVTGNLAVDEGVLAEAKERGVSLMVSPYDSATTSWIIRSAQRVGNLVTREVVTFRPEETVASVRRKVSQQVQPIYCVVDEDGRLLGVISKSDLLKNSSLKLILVDHNEISQAVPGADQVSIVEILDHHRLGNLPTEQPILFFNEPVGSTCTIVAECFRKEAMTPRAELAGILMAGIISDTLNLKGPTATAKDAAILEWLAAAGKVDRESLADLIFTSGSVINAMEPEAVIRSDMKIYNEGEIRFSVSQIEELGFANFRTHAKKLMDALGVLQESEGLYFAALLVTDINRQDSLLQMVGPEEFLDQVAYSQVEAHTYDMPGVVSRKKQLIPYLTSLLRNAGLLSAVG